jgi:hypothetical protein
MGHVHRGCQFHATLLYHLRVWRCTVAGSIQQRVVQLSQLSGWATCATWHVAASTCACQVDVKPRPARNPSVLHWPSAMAHTRLCRLRHLQRPSQCTSQSTEPGTGQAVTPSDCNQ